MPKQALLIYFGLAFVGAVIFVWFSFPVQPNKYSTSKNQPVPLHSNAGFAPEPVTAPAVPVFVTIPDTPAAAMTGKVLHVFAYGSGNTAERLRQELDLYTHQTGNSVTEVIASSSAPYNPALADALRSPAPPDIVLVDASDLSGLTPEKDLLPATIPQQGPLYIPQVQGSFVRAGQFWAVPDEYSVDVLFYNKLCFDRVGMGYPGNHWTLDILEAICRGITLSALTDPQGRRIFALELPADFHLWNLLCAEAGRAVCDASGWHLGDPKANLQHVRGLDFFQTYFRDLDVIVPLTNDEQSPGDLFVQGRASMLIAPIETRDRFAQNPSLNWGVTRFPQDIQPATNLRVRGWAVAKTTRFPQEAAHLAQSLANLPVSDGWVSALAPTTGTQSDGPTQLAYSMIPSAIFYPTDLNTLGLEHTLTQQLQHFAQTNSDGITTDALYKTLVSQALPESQHIQVQTGLPQMKKKK